MKKVSRFSVLFMFSILIWSCEKKVDFDFKENELRYVIEGRISNEPGMCKVMVSKTKEIGDGNEFKGLSGAVVKVENDGQITTLAETAKGVYSVSTINGQPGQTYKLTVVVEGQTFTASSTMPEPVPFLDLYIKEGDFNRKSTFVTAKFKDPLAVRNYYWFRKYINDQNQKDYDVLDDELIAGQEVNQRLNFSNETNNDANDIKKGDQLRVDLYCIDVSVYNYLFSLYGANGNGGSTAPTNPLSNISGGALGFFSAYAIQSRKVTVP